MNRSAQEKTNKQTLSIAKRLLIGKKIKPFAGQ